MQNAMVLTLYSFGSWILLSHTALAQTAGSGLTHNNPATSSTRYSTATATSRPEKADTSWAPLNLRVENDARYVTALGGSGELILIGADPFIYRSRDGGNSWQETKYKNDHGGRIYSFLKFNDLTFAATGGGLFRSLDNGDNWHQLPIEAPSITAIASQGEKIFAGGVEFHFPFPSTLYASSDTGMSWHHANFPQFTWGSYVQAIASSQSFVFVGVGNNVYRSANGGSEWTFSNKGIPHGIRIISLCVVGDILLAGTNNGVYASTDQGENWQEQATGMESGTSINALISIGRSALAATSRGVYLAVNLSTPWNPMNNGLPSTSLDAKSLYIHGQRMYAATDSGVWERSLGSILTNADKPPLVSQHFALHQNYPNPFNPSTEIRYQISEVSHVTLTVFDVLGREVATLVNGEKEAGTHRLRWDATGLPSGVYLYRLKANGFVETRKMILTR